MPCAICCATHSIRHEAHLGRAELIGRNIRINVDDDGIGIPPAERDTSSPPSPASTRSRDAHEAATSLDTGHLPRRVLELQQRRRHRRHTPTRRRRSH